MGEQMSPDYPALIADRLTLWWGLSWVMPGTLLSRLLGFEAVAGHIPEELAADEDELATLPDHDWKMWLQLAFLQCRTILGPLAVTRRTPAEVRGLFAQVDDAVTELQVAAYLAAQQLVTAAPTKDFCGSPLDDVLDALVAAIPASDRRAVILHMHCIVLYEVQRAIYAGDDGAARVTVTRIGD